MIVVMQAIVAEHMKPVGNYHAPRETCVFVCIPWSMFSKVFAKA